ncbi:unnamed protein product [Calypogeia fissa]
MQSTRVLGCEAANVAAGPSHLLLARWRRPARLKYECLQFYGTKNLLSLEKKQECLQFSRTKKSLSLEKNASSRAMGIGRTAFTRTAISVEECEKQDMWRYGGRFEKPVTTKCFAVPKNRREFDEFIDPAMQDPPEMEDEDQNLTKFDKVARETARVRKSQQAEYERTKPIFLKAIGIDPDEYEGPPNVDGEEDEDVGERAVEDEEVNDLRGESGNENDDFFTVLDRAVANMKRPIASKRNAKKAVQNGGRKKAAKGALVEEDEELEIVEAVSYDGNLVDIEEEEDSEELDEVEETVEDEVDDILGDLQLEEIAVDPKYPPEEFLEEEDEEEDEEDEDSEPFFRMTLAELLDEAKVTPLALEGNLDVEITGIQHDSREVNPGEMFVCCKGLTVDGHLYTSEAIEKGASVLVVSKEVNLSKSVSAVVVVEDTNSVLSALAGAFYGHPSRKLAVIGITGTNGKTTTSTLLRSMYEAMGVRTGLLGTIAYYINNNIKLDSPKTTPDAVHLQQLMARMVHSGTEACVMEVSSHALALDRCKEVDFDVAVFTNLTRDHMDFHLTEEEYRAAKGKLFAKMVDPVKHRKVVNIDDPNAAYFIAQGNADVPVVTYALENTDADVYPLEVLLSLFETELLVRTPKGNIEISSGLLGRHNVYNILAAVAVGIAVEAPLKEIVRGIEEVDAVPGRCELIDEEQAFAVIVDYAHTPDALSRLLDTVRECGAQRIISVVGCGGDRDKGKRPMMAKIATDKSDVCIFTSDNPRTEEPLDILDDMLAGVGWSMKEYLKWGETDYYPPLPNGHRLFVYDIRTIAVRAGVAMGEEGDAVVIAGKGHETYQIIGTEKQYFDDREECREALQHLDALHAAGVDTSEFPWRVLESN